MNIFGIGIDIIEIDRIENAIKKNPRFLERNFTEKEVLYFKENLMQRKNQMNDRLQKMLLKKYALTKNQRYLA